MPFSHVEAILVDEVWDMQGDTHFSAWILPVCQCMISVLSIPLPLQLQWFQSPSFMCRKYSGEQVKLSVITNWLASRQAIIKKTKPEKLHCYWMPGVCQPKDSAACPIFCGPFEDEICCPVLGIKPGRTACRSSASKMFLVFAWHGTSPLASE